MLNEKQVEEIKSQLIDQIAQIFPEGKREDAKRKIISMNTEELEDFLKQNKMMQNSEQQNPFRLIADGKIPSNKIDENKHCLAVLELNPISEGHTLIIPKTPIKEGKKVPAYLSNFAEKISRKIKTKLKPKDILAVPTPMFDETVINILPVYKDETLNSERRQASQEELQEILNKISKETIKLTKPKSEKIKKDKKLWLPKRIP
jgi:histidine triad (HIT) family protein